MVPFLENHAMHPYGLQSNNKKTFINKSKYPETGSSKMYLSYVIPSIIQKKTYPLSSNACNATTIFCKM